MSNFLAIATVTAALSQVLRNVVRNDVNGAEVTSVDPTNSNGLPPTRVNLYLYQVLPNAALRNSDLPTRRDDGSLIQRPKVALDLYYLLTFYGDDSRLEPQRLLGSVVSTLQAHPMLTRDIILSTIGDSSFDFLSKSDLGDALEMVKFTPLTLSVDELSKLWSIFFQVPSKLSVAYKGTAVIIEGSETPNEHLPVLTPNVYAVPFQGPIIDSLDPQAVVFNQPNPPAISIRGQNLLSDDTLVYFGDSSAPPEQGSNNEQLTVFLPLDLQAGINSVRVVHRIFLGSPEPHKGFESNVAAIVLRPKITKGLRLDNSLNPPGYIIDMTPKIGQRQRAYLLLNELITAIPSNPHSYEIQPRPRITDIDRLVFDLNGVAPGTYLVRLRVDGAESILKRDENPESPTFNRFIGPQVAVR